MMLDAVKTDLRRGRELLSEAGDDLEQVHAGVQMANRASMALVEGLAGDMAVDGELIAATEALIRAAAAVIPELQRAELDVLALLASSEGSAALEPARVRRLADARARSMTTSIDLSRSLAKAYEKAFAAMGGAR